MDNIFIDTDVILDFYLDRMPHADYSSELLSLIENKQLKGFVTPVIISNTYYILRKIGTHQKVIEKLSQLLNLIDVLNIDKSIILTAIASDFTDFEDALQNYAAEQANNIKVIITRNPKDFKTSNLSVMSPQDYLASR